MTKKIWKERRVALLGSTGSVGRQAADVAKREGIPVTALAASQSVDLLEEQIRCFRPALCALRSESAAADLKVRVADTGVRILAGPDAAAEAAAASSAEIVLNAVTGFAGLAPTLAAIEAGKDVALANKETLVTAGRHVMASAAEHGVRILPVDSEHCAIYQCLCAGGGDPVMAGSDPRVKRLILTASGGPFRGYSAAELSKVTREDALRHPSWNMGPKITVDSATLMNKGFEVIEAARLYGMPAERIGVVVHPESVIHSMVEYTDGAILAQMAVPDMRLCIAYALSCPDRIPEVTAPLDLTRIGSLTFVSPDTERFPLLALAFEALRRGGIAPAVLNAADEEAVGDFLRGTLSFAGVTQRVTEVFERMTVGMADLPEPSVADIMEADKETRRCYAAWKEQASS